MQAGAVSDTFDADNFRALRLDPEDAARIHQDTVHNHVARAAVAVVAALFRPRQPQFVAQDLQQALARLAEEIDLFTVDPGRYLRTDWHTQAPPARAMAVVMTRRVRTPARCLRCP